MSAGYGWIIDKDHISSDLGSIDFDERDEAGTMGPANIDDLVKAALEKGRGQRFRMFDDDRTLYYEGRIIFLSNYEAPDMMFEPLDDFGTPNAGCTIIQYRNRQTGDWEDL